MARNRKLLLILSLLVALSPLRLAYAGIIDLSAAVDMDTTLSQGQCADHQISCDHHIAGDINDNHCNDHCDANSSAQLPNDHSQNGFLIPSGRFLLSPQLQLGEYLVYPPYRPPLQIS